MYFSDMSEELLIKNNPFHLGSNRFEIFLEIQIICLSIICTLIFNLRKIISNFKEILNSKHSTAFFCHGYVFKFRITKPTNEDLNPRVKNIYRDIEYVRRLHYTMWLIGPIANFDIRVRFQRG